MKKYPTDLAKAKHFLLIGFGSCSTFIKLRIMNHDDFSVDILALALHVFLVLTDGRAIPESVAAVLNVSYCELIIKHLCNSHPHYY